jgi:CheY-like chemotaxis protein
MISGFDAAAGQALAPCFGRRSLIAYLPADSVPQADLVVVNGDDPDATEQAQRLLQPQRVLFVGKQPPAGARWSVPLPLDAAAVLARLDELVAAEKPAPHAFTDPLLYLIKRADTSLSFRGFDGRERAALAEQHDAPAAPPSRGEASVDPFPPVPLATGLAAEAWMTPAAASPPLASPQAPAELPESTDAASLAEPVTKASMRAAVRRAQRESMPARGPAVSAALIVERHPPSRLLLVDLLGSFGFQPVSAASVEQAEQQLVERAFGVVFLGLVDDPQGEVAGIELCHRIKQQALSLPALPPRVVMTWPRPRAADHVRARLAGCDHFITGPIGRGPVAKALEAIGLPMPQDPRGRGLEAGEAVRAADQRSVSTTGA